MAAIPEIQSMEEFHRVAQGLEERLHKHYKFMLRFTQVQTSDTQAQEIEEAIASQAQGVKEAEALQAWSAKYRSPPPSPPGLSAAAVPPPPPPASHSSSSRLPRAAPVPQYRRVYTEADFYFEKPGGVMYCKLCNKEATEGHVNSKMHINRSDWPESYLDEGSAGPFLWTGRW